MTIVPRQFGSRYLHTGRRLLDILEPDDGSLRLSQSCPDHCVVRRTLLDTDLRGLRSLARHTETQRLKSQTVTELPRPLRHKAKSVR